jgi:quercetin dioxygenase-like cupin family protein
MNSTNDMRPMMRKRINYPYFKYYGNITEGSLHTLLQHFKDTPNTLMETTRLLREYQLDDSVAKLTPDIVADYGQYDIQTHVAGTPYVEDNFSKLKDEFKPVYDELAYMLSSSICRMRYATIEKNDDLEYHIDQPGKDRFVVVIDGEHVIHVKAKNGKYIKQLMLPGELWYLNSNWEHRVENTGDGLRLALLGCFEYSN